MNKSGGVVKLVAEEAAWDAESTVEKKKKKVIVSPKCKLITFCVSNDVIMWPKVLHFKSGTPRDMQVEIQPIHILPER